MMVHAFRRYGIISLPKDCNFVSKEGQQVQNSCNALKRNGRGLGERPSACHVVEVLAWLLRSTCTSVCTHMREALGHLRVYLKVLH